MKRTVGDLAYFGGPEAFLHNLYVGRPTPGDRERFFARLEWALNNHWLTNEGPLVRELEGRLADIAGVQHCVATANATIALQLLLRATEVSDQVIMPSLTFSATAHAAGWLGLEPVFCDVERESGSLDPDLLATLITPRTSAIVGVHLWGRPAQVDALGKIAAEHGIPLFFDAAHALGCTSRGRPVGSFGSAEVFSLHATKAVTSFEGGAIVTDDGELARRVRAMHNFGLDSTKTVVDVGTNGKMSECAAAMGLTSLDAFEETKAHSRANYLLYRRELDELPGIDVLPFDQAESHNYQYVIISIDQQVIGLHRDQIQTLLRAEKVFAQPYFSPACHQLSPYRTTSTVGLENTEWLSERILAVPTGPSVSAEDIRRVCGIIRIAARNGKQISAQWRNASDG